VGLPDETGAGTADAIDANSAVPRHSMVSSWKRIVRIDSMKGMVDWYSLLSENDNACVGVEILFQSDQFKEWVDLSKEQAGR